MFHISKENWIINVLYKFEVHGTLDYTFKTPYNFSPSVLNNTTPNMSDTENIDDKGTTLLAENMGASQKCCIVIARP
jgi:hypothetical protein